MTIKTIFLGKYTITINPKIMTGVQKALTLAKETITNLLHH